MRRGSRRLAVVLTVTALSAAAWVAGPAWGQAAPSDSGGADRGESASAWHDVLSFLGWILLAVVVFGLLLWMVLGRRREGAQPQAAAGRGRRPRRRPRRRRSCRGATARTPASSRSSPSITSRAPSVPTRTLVGARATRHGCARSSSWSAIATAGSWSAGPSRGITSMSTTWRTPSARTPWWGRRPARWSGWPSGRRASPWASSPAASPAVSTRPPPTLPEESGALFDEIRHDIPEGSSGIVALVSADDSAALIEALHERAIRLTHHRLSDAEAAALRAAVAQAPRPPRPTCERRPR